MFSIEQEAEKRVAILNEHFSETIVYELLVQFGKECYAQGNMDKCDLTPWSKPCKEMVHHIDEKLRVDEKLRDEYQWVDLRISPNNLPEHREKVLVEYPKGTTKFTLSIATYYQNTNSFVSAAVKDVQPWRWKRLW